MYSKYSEKYDDHQIYLLKIKKETIPSMGILIRCETQSVKLTNSVAELNI